jgi:uncharacterized protein YegP (UPF0339 family)
MFSKIQSVRALAVVALFSLATLNVACSAAPETDSQSTEDETSAELSSKSAHFETFVGADGKVYFDLVAANGQNVLRSQGYTRQDSADAGVASVLANAIDPAAYDVKEATNGEYYFNVRAANYAVIATSQMYSTKSNATRAAATVRGLVRLTGAPAKTVAAPRLERFETFKGENGQSYFRLRAGNGEPVLSSQGYTRMESALGGIESVRANGASTASFRVFETADGQYAFNLVASNGQVIGRGESYVSKSNADRAVARIAEMLRAGVATAE